MRFHFGRPRGSFISAPPPRMERISRMCYRSQRDISACSPFDAAQDARRVSARIAAAAADTRASDTRAFAQPTAAIEFDEHRRRRRRHAEPPKVASRRLLPARCEPRIYYCSLGTLPQPAAADAFMTICCRKMPPFPCALSRHEKKQQKHFARRAAAGHSRRAESAKPPSSMHAHVAGALTGRHYKCNRVERRHDATLAASPDASAISFILIARRYFTRCYYGDVDAHFILLMRHYRLISFQLYRLTSRRHRREQ